MPSVMGLLEEREVAARQRVESLRGELDRLVAELEKAEAARDRLVIARETVSQVLSEAGEAEDVQVSWEARSVAPGPAASGAVPRSVVPVRREGLDVTVLPSDYQRIMHALADRERSGPRTGPGEGRGCVAKAKRLAARGRLVEDTPGSFSVAAWRDGGS